MLCCRIFTIIIVKSMANSKVVKTCSGSGVRQVASVSSVVSAVVSDSVVGMVSAMRATVTGLAVAVVRLGVVGVSIKPSFTSIQVSSGGSTSWDSAGEVVSHQG